MLFSRLSGLIAAVAIVLAVSTSALADPPSSFDLRNYNGHNYVTSVKSQQGGTCWTHGAMAAMEGNLLMTGVWAGAGEYGEPALAEYHLDWWNGFNRNNNDDTIPPTGAGLTVHEGGDYRVTTAYLARGEGAVREVDGQSYSTPPARSAAGYHRYYARDIEWYVAGPSLENIHAIQQAVMTHGVMGTCLCSSSSFLSGDYVHYQPPGDSQSPNHAVAIVGWDDNKLTQAPQPGAWLCKNSWGTSWGYSGYFWISYWDKHAGQHPEMGAISFQGVEPLAYDHIYYHDYHGWRDTKTDCAAACNAFTSLANHVIQSVSLFTAADNASYTVKIYDRFEGGQLLDELATQSGTIAHTGLHTIDLAAPPRVLPGNDFYIYVQLSAGGYAYDRSSDIPVLLGGSQRTWVESSSAPGQSYYSDGRGWYDLHDWSDSANFCIKGLAVDYLPLTIELPEGAPDFLPPGVLNTFPVQITSEMENFVPGTGQLHYRNDGGVFHTFPLQALGGDTLQATLPVADCAAVPEYYFSAQGTAGATVLNPPGAPNTVFHAVMGTKTNEFNDNFETNLGWTVQNTALTGGAWERGVPVGGGLRGDPLADHDGSGQCYLTGNVMGDSDVDGGPTRLISPTFDLSDGRFYQISYARWFTNDDHDEDRLTVEISNNNGSSWVTVESVPDSMAWITHTFNVSDFVAPTAQVKVRFSASDNPSNSITEAAIDAFAVFGPVCTPPNGLGDLNCDGVTDFADINPFVIAVSNFAAYEATYPGCPLSNRDINDDGEFGFGDINPFVNLLSK